MDMMNTNAQQQENQENKKEQGQVQEAAKSGKEALNKASKNAKRIKKIVMAIKAIITFILTFWKVILISIIVATIVGAIVDFLNGGDDDSESNAYSGGSFSNSADGTNSGTLHGTSQEEKTWNFLIAHGASKEGAAAMMGNIEKESTFNVKATNGTNTGLCQWSNNDRFKNLEQYAKDKNKQWDDLQTQLEFMWHELETVSEYKVVHTAIIDKKSPNINEITKIIMEKYEKPGDNSLAKRQEYAQKWYEKFKDLNTTDTAMTNGINLYDNLGYIDNAKITELENYLNNDIVKVKVGKITEKDKGRRLSKMVVFGLGL